MTNQEIIKTNKIETNEDKINRISKYLSFEISKYFFDIIIKNNYHIDNFLKSFKKNLSEIIYETLVENNEKSVISNVFNYYSIIAINKGVKSNDICYKELELNDLEDGIDIELMLDEYFKINDHTIKASIDDIDIYLMPLHFVKKIIK